MPRRFALHLIAANAVLLAAMWLSTGTMAPYAATQQYPAVLEPCHYLVSIDHEHFTAVYHFISGDEPSAWGFSVVLRRLLFPLLAFPLTRIFGILAGGVMASFALQILGVTGFAFFVRRRVGESAAIAVLWLLATYPGITYWSGLPYSYVTIVPGSLACLMLLYRLQVAPSAREVITLSLLLGILFVGYDLFFAFFGTAAALILLCRRRVLWTAMACAAMATPTLLVALLFVAISQPLINTNTVSYVNVLRGYLHPRELGLWLRYLAELPLVFSSSFVFGNMIVLPLLFVAVCVIARRRRIAVLELPEVALLIGGLLLFLLTNAAPPYYGWQVRGHWMARLYQPVFPAFLMAIARVAERVAAERWWRAALVAAVVANGSIAFGPVLMNPLAAEVYHRFYIHSPADSLLINLRRFGRRPLGVCRSTHEWDHAGDAIKTWKRPPYMFRPPPAGD